MLLWNSVNYHCFFWFTVEKGLNCICNKIIVKYSLLKVLWAICIWHYLWRKERRGMALIWKKCNAWLTRLHTHAPNNSVEQANKIRTHELWSHQIDEHLLFHYSEIKGAVRIKNYNLYLNLYTTSNIYTSTNIATKSIQNPLR